MARINQDDIDTLRDRVDFVDIVSGYSQLKKSGGRRFIGLCPFHSEKTPSFNVDAAKGLFICYGCKEGGDVFTFIEKIENLSFAESAEWLARRVGMDLRYEEMRPGEQKAQGVKARLIEANAAAAKFFNESLFTMPEGDGARRYLESRGFDKEVARRWMLGYAPGRNLLTRHLTSKGFTEEEILGADLSKRSDRDGSLYDTFRNRIIFPTWNHQGNVVGFGARILEGEGPKYLNSAETRVFQKSRLMYGLDRAKAAIARGEHAIVVEGYTDVIALHEGGVTEAVATNGVALGEGHFELLKKWTQRVVLMLDADTAGQGATERSFEIQHKTGVEVLVATLPEGRDPAEIVAEQGSEAIAIAIEKARPLLEFKLDQTLAKLQLDTPEAKARAVREAAKVLGWHPDPIARHEYAFMVAERVGVDPEGIQRALSEEGGAQLSGDTGTTPTGRALPGQVKVEREALQLLLTQGGAVFPLAGDVAEADFTSNARRELFTAALIAREDGRASDDARFAQTLTPEARTLFTELAVGAEELDDVEVERRARELFVRLKLFSLERNIKARKVTLEDVNPLDDPQRHDALFTQLVGLEAEKRDLLKNLQGTP